MKTPRSRRPSNSDAAPIHPLGSRPVSLKQGSVEVVLYPAWNRIYRRDPATGEKVQVSQHPQFVLSYYAGAKRVLKKFSELAVAKEAANRALVSLANGETEALKLTGRDQNIYLTACEDLRRWNPDLPLDTAIKEYVAAAKELGTLKATLADAVREFVARHKTIRESRLISDLVTEFLAVKEKAGKSERYLGDLARLHKFADAFQIPVQQITGPMLQLFFDHLGTPRTQVNYWRLVRSLLRFAVRRKYAPRDLLEEMEGVELPDLAPTKTEVFTPDELRAMLDHTRPMLTPWLVIAAFAGLRSAEILRLDWSDVNLDRKLITVDATKAKTAARRVVPLCDAAVAWLKPYAKAEGRIAFYTEENKFCQAVKADVSRARRDAGQPSAFQWRRNGLRHSFCSYRLALNKNVAEVSLEAGNSPNMIFKHYRELVAEDDARRWFQCFPSSPATNIIPLAAAA